jgi:3-methyladenine DNA glycosylase AlkD
MNAEEVLRELGSKADPTNVEGMARYGISPHNTLGVCVCVLRDLAKEIGKDHDLAKELWGSGIHEARILASYIEDPKLVTEDQMESWAKDFDSWDVCDQVSGLFEQTPYARKKVFEWSRREEEFVKRTAFAIIAGLSVHDKKASDEKFEQFFPIIKRESTDERNYVRKAVNWALRNIGKRNASLNRRAIEVAEEIQKIDSKSARWIASDALRELKSGAIQKRVEGKKI